MIYSVYVKKFLDKQYGIRYNSPCCRKRHRGIAKLVRHGILNPACVGSSPATPAIRKFGAAIICGSFCIC